MFTGPGTSQDDEQEAFFEHCDHNGSSNDYLCETKEDTEGSAIKESVSASKPSNRAQELGLEVKHKKVLLRSRSWQKNW